MLMMAKVMRLHVAHNAYVVHALDPAACQESVQVMSSALYPTALPQVFSK